MMWGDASLLVEVRQVVLKGKAKKPGFKPGGGMPEVAPLRLFRASRGRTSMPVRR